MSYIVGSLPPIKCWIKREFLYNFEKGHGELEPAIWFSLKALRGQVFRIESLLPNYGALYDKLPSKFVTPGTQRSRQALTKPALSSQIGFLRRGTLPLSNSSSTSLRCSCLAFFSGVNMSWWRQIC